MDKSSTTAGEIAKEQGGYAGCQRNNQTHTRTQTEGKVKMSQNKQVGRTVQQKASRIKNARNRKECKRKTPQTRGENDRGNPHAKGENKRGKTR